MKKRLEVYKCELCGNIVEMVHPGGGDLICCGQKMTLFTENTVEASKEKHIPVIEPIPGGYKVKVGSVTHPSEPNHYIQWIDLIAGDIVLRRYLKPGDVPEAVFMTDAKEVYAREYCNLHGLWRG